MQHVKLGIKFEGFLRCVTKCGTNQLIYFKFKTTYV